MANKKNLRKNILNKIKLISKDQKQEYSKKICHQLIIDPDYQTAQHVLLYSAIFSEVDVTQVFNHDQNNKYFYFPRVHQDKLEICLVKNYSDLQKGYHNILEPKPYCPQVNIEKLDLIIVPGLVFDLNGNRLGKGKGFYDKFLNNYHKTTIALAFREQIIEKIPTEKHDIPVSKVITILPE